MNRLQKEQLISDVRADLSGMSLVIVARQNGVTVAKSTQLRRDVRGADAKVRVLKNTLLGIAVKNTEFAKLGTFLKGPVILAYSKDPVGVAKVISKFASDNDGKLEIVAGVLNGQMLDARSVSILAELPSLDELRARLVGLVVATATKIVRTINEPAARVARVLALRT
jgi:large subunit ribosomal protein L10